MKSIARVIADSFLFANARRLLEKNQADWDYPLSKLQKLEVGSYLILKDYSEGLFPPATLDEEQTFEAERNYNEVRRAMGSSEDELFLSEMQKPFWFGNATGNYLTGYIQLQQALFDVGLRPPARIVEVGCGSGWVAEFLAGMGFKVVATTIEETAARFIERRRESLEVKGLPHDIEFRVSPMEYVDERTADLPRFDAVFVFEALHHAHSWKRSIDAFYKCLNPGGWCFILNEPNLLHTFVSYRVGKLSNTHEIGMNPEELKQHLRKTGFRDIRILRNRFHLFAKPIWIAARR